MKTDQEMQDIIDDEVLVDCYTDEEANMGWFYYMEENLEFPFKAQLEVKKRDGSKELKIVEVIGLSTTDANFGGEEFYFEISYSEEIVETSLSKLKNIEASSETLEAIQIWNFWNNN